MANCFKCIYYNLNFWNYNECWARDQELDKGNTFHTANREADYIFFSQNNSCLYFKKKLSWRGKLCRQFLKYFSV